MVISPGNYRNLAGAWGYFSPPSSKLKRTRPWTPYPGPNALHRNRSLNSQRRWPTTDRNQDATHLSLSVSIYLYLYLSGCCELFVFVLIEVDWNIERDWCPEWRDRNWLTKIKTSTALNLDVVYPITTKNYVLYFFVIIPKFFQGREFSIFHLPMKATWP